MKLKNNALNSHGKEAAKWTKQAAGVWHTLKTMGACSAELLFIWEIEVGFEQRGRNE
jgi:hypothetical protein